MAVDGVRLSKGAPQFLGGGAPATAADQNAMMLWGNTAIDRAVATIAALSTVTSDDPLYTGKITRVTACPGAWFRYNGGSWDMFGTPEFADSAARSTAIPAPSTGWKSKLAVEPFERRWNGSAWVPLGARFQVERTASQSMTSGSPILNGFWGTPVETDATFFSFAAGVLTVLEPGRYRVGLRVQLAAASGTAYTVGLLKNTATVSAGATVLAGTGIASTLVQGFVDLAGDITLADNDTLRAYVSPSATLAAGDAYTGAAGGQLTVERLAFT